LLIDDEEHDDKSPYFYFFEVVMPSPKDTHGSIVKTGPTAGENRSRDEDGQWRAKRSDAGKPREKK